MERNVLNRFFTWDIHYRCNYYCTYCFLHSEPETANIEAIYLDLEEWIRIWEDNYKRYGHCQISITGGEPFIYPHFMNLIAKLQEFHTFEFSTNLSWDAEDFMHLIRPERVIINSSFHHEFASVKDFINKVMLLRNNKYRVSITVVGYPPFLEDIASYKPEFEKEGFDLIIFPYRGPFEGRKYPEGYTEPEKELLKKLGNSVGSETNKALYDTWVDKKQGKPQERVCRMGQMYAKIVPDGRAYRCCAAVNKEWGNLGNIAEDKMNLMSDPAICIQPSQNCACYRAMLIGESEKWLKRWDVIDKSVKAVDVKAREDAVEGYVE